MIMKSLLFIVFLFLSFSSISQENDFKKEECNSIKKSENWSLSASTGFINIPSPNLGNNVWTSVNLGYSKNNFSFVFWGGSNYWIEGKKPDLRLGFTTSYTILKW